ncbi:MAG: carbon-nitrogen hydrolase family protein [Thermodesulfobacteriota bacterium]|nr:carbon-nitrogen hydrolase family protein [Thermodesulfobacteriota bacterium]
MKKEKKENLRIALVQSEYDPLDIKSLLKYMAWAESSDIICFPEAFAAGRTIEKTAQYLKIINEEKDNILNNLTKVREASNSCIILPLVEKTENGKLYNTSFVLYKGKLLGKYYKIHVFPWGEFFFDCGEDQKVFELDKCSVGVMICYDAAFPETARILALKGADIIFISASWPQEAAYLWKSRLIARALDNQVFLAGVNRCGSVGSEIFMGGSLVVDPRGDVLAQCGNAEQILILDIDLNIIEKEREQEPVWQTFDRSIYQKVLEDKE